jgi:hypothetical protein
LICLLNRANIYVCKQTTERKQRIKCREEILTECVMENCYIFVHGQADPAIKNLTIVDFSKENTTAHDTC